MAKIFKITEEQYKRALEEGINIGGGDGTVDVKSNDSQSTTYTANSSDPNNPLTLTVDNQNSPSVSESRIITKQEFLAERRKRLKESSEMISVSSLLK